MPKSKCGRALVADRVPIVQLMFLYEARARAPRTGTSAAQLGTHLGMIGTRKGQKPKETHQEMTLDTVLLAG